MTNTLSAQTTPPPSPCHIVADTSTTGSFSLPQQLPTPTTVAKRSRKKLPQRALVLSPSEKKHLKIITLDVYSAYARNPSSLLSDPHNHIINQVGTDSNSGNEFASVEKKVVKKTRKRKRFQDIEGRKRVQKK
jgi:hypothetical protein